MIHEFTRTEMLIGSEGLDALKNSTVAVFGIGGVGSFVVDASPEKPDSKYQIKKRKTPGSVSFVPSVAGLIIASEVVKDLIKK